MNTQLAQALIERGIINPTTRIIAKCPIRAFGNAPIETRVTLTVNKAVKSKNNIKFISTDRAGRKFSVPADKILIIDGMDPVRLAAAYDIKATGDKRAAGKKRGRKPKAS